MGNLWFDLSRDSVKLLLGSLYNVTLTANIAPAHHLSPLRELLGGRVWIGRTPLSGASIDVEMEESGNAAGASRTFSTLTGEKGAFVLPVPFGMKATYYEIGRASCRERV